MKTKTTTVLWELTVLIQIEGLKSGHKDYKEVKSLDVIRKRKEVKEIFISGV